MITMGPETREIIRKMRAERHDRVTHDRDGTITRDGALRRWPRLVAHVICTSLGYATPLCAAGIVADAHAGRKNNCEWVDACYNQDAQAVIRHAIRSRRTHHGYMAEYVTALELVYQSACNGVNPSLASWF